MPFLLGTSDWAAATAAGGDYAMDWHVHDCAMLLLPRAGKLGFAVEGAGRSERLLRPGEALAMAPGMGHRTRAADAAHRHLVLYVPGPWLAGWVGAAGWRAGPVPASLLPLLAYRDGLGDGDGRARLADRLILAEAAACPPPPLAREQGAAVIHAVAAHLAAHPDGRHDLDALARRFGLSRRHLTRLFRRHAGESIGTHLSRLRARAAGTHLAAGAGRLAAAWAAGLSSPSQLARLMRRHGKARSD